MDQGFDFVVVGNEASVVSQYPEAGTKLSTGQRIYLLSEQGDQPTIPDLRGESLRDALEVLSLLKIGISVDGEGYVLDQTEEMKDGKTHLTLKLEPLNEYGENIPVEPPVEETTESENGP